MFVLLVIAINLLTPNDPSILGHRVYNTKAQCEAKAEEVVKETPTNLRVAAFCVKASDLLSLNEA